MHAGVCGVQKGGPVQGGGKYGAHVGMCTCTCKHKHMQVCGWQRHGAVVEVCRGGHEGCGTPCRQWACVNC